MSRFHRVAAGLYYDAETTLPVRFPVGGDPFADPDGEPQPAGTDRDGMLVVRIEGREVPWKRAVYVAFVDASLPPRARLVETVPGRFHPHTIERTSPDPQRVGLRYTYPLADGRWRARIEAHGIDEIHGTEWRAFRSAMLGLARCGDTKRRGKAMKHARRNARHREWWFDDLAEEIAELEQFPAATVAATPTPKDEQ